mmetsp:Transcript_45191/g.118629  ORF Transcript_45191/g.118629 Transcript_45191/m.118629 type:complete len:244 (+) Transcript_45191:317-1048(+)
MTRSRRLEGSTGNSEWSTSPLRNGKTTIRPTVRTNNVRVEMLLAAGLAAGLVAEGDWAASEMEVEPSRSPHLSSARSLCPRLKATIKLIIGTAAFEMEVKPPPTNSMLLSMSNTALCSGSMRPIASPTTVAMTGGRPSSEHSWRTAFTRSPATPSIAGPLRSTKDAVNIMPGWLRDVSLVLAAEGGEGGGELPSTLISCTFVELAFGAAAGDGVEASGVGTPTGSLRRYEKATTHVFTASRAL